MRLFKKTHIDFIGKRRYWYVVSSAMMVFGIVSLFTKGITLGIDFRGGTELVVSFSQPVAVADVRTALGRIGLGKSEIKSYGAANSLLIRSTEQAEGMAVGDKIKSALQSEFPGQQLTVLREDKIGPKIGKELRRDALYAVIWSILAILAYVAIRFRFAFGMGAIIAIVHDVFTTLGFLSLLDGVFPHLNLEISQEVIAAFLTLIGVSVNDTVVIFDRIRENEKNYRSMQLLDVMNRSLNETLSRTIITSGTIFLVLLTLLLFGGEVNRGFAFTMGFGIVTGTYSSIYVASAFVIDWKLLRTAKSA